MKNSSSGDLKSDQAFKGNRDWKNVFLSCIDSFPTPTDKSRALYFYTQDEYSDLDGSAEIIRKDPFLSVEVVRSSNSAVYGSRGADSLEDAVNAIGIERLGRIALRIWLKNVIPQSLATYFLSGSSFVNRALGSGAAMRFLYEEDPVEAETAYAIGLLHSIGKIVVNEAIKKGKLEDLCFEQSQTQRLVEAEQEVFGMTHAEVGAFALEAWGFSEKVYGPIGRQFSKSDLDSEDDWAQSLVVARMIADWVIEAVRGTPDPLRGKGGKLYRGKRLGEIFDYTLAVVENEMISDLG